MYPSEVKKGQCWEGCFYSELTIVTWQNTGGNYEKQYEFFLGGDDAAVMAIAKALPGGWTGGTGLMPPTEDAVKFWTQFGGSAPDTAFWGISGQHHGNVLRTVLSIVE